MRGWDLLDRSGRFLVANLSKLRDRHLPTIVGFVFLCQLPCRDQLWARRGHVVLHLCKLRPRVVPGKYGVADLLTLPDGDLLHVSRLFSSVVHNMLCGHGEHHAVRALCIAPATQARMTSSHWQ